MTHRVFFENNVLVYEITGTGSGGNGAFNNFAGTTLFRPSAESVTRTFGRRENGTQPRIFLPAPR